MTGYQWWARVGTAAVLTAVIGRRDPFRDGYLIASAVWVVAIAVGLVPAGTDASNFYVHLGDPYVAHDYATGQGFYYAPPVALALRLLLPFGVQIFAAVMSGIGLAALGWIGGRWAWALLFFPPVWWDISAGNVNTLIGAVSIAMLTRPAWSGLLALTKVTPGVVGLWWVARGEWRAVREAVLFTGFVCLISLVIVPNWWAEWISALSSNGAGYTGPGYFTVAIPLVPRLAFAAVLVVIGARRGWIWVLPLAACAALPVLWWTGLAAVVAIIHRSRRCAFWPGSPHPAP